ncbi:MAG TPA: aminodeoxychorismate/anthranilate synthase component II [Candidatus Bathyarchaeia archaeon]|nr:aminodeoxychorismate/anthranilate synthase component II [Candidatus Bathyarchaeia archaeon]
MKVLVIDNYDSFVYNLVQYVRELGAEVVVRRNDVGIEELKKIKADRVIISPGPGRPESAGVSEEVVKELRCPILGVCLGHQVIGHVFGARIGYARRLMHGKVSEIHHDSKGLLKGVKNPFHATRYHSLVVCETDLPSCLQISARAEDGEIMGIRHRTLPIEGVQFHPESILTGEGRKIIENFLRK